MNGNRTMWRNRTPEKLGDCRELYLIQPYLSLNIGGFAVDG